MFFFFNFTIFEFHFPNLCSFYGAVIQKKKTISSLLTKLFLFQHLGIGCTQINLSKMAPNPFKRCKVDPSCLKDESLILICDWENCTEEDGRRKVFQDMEVFLLHVAEVCIKKNDNLFHLHDLFFGRY